MCIMMLENDVSATEGVVLDPISPKQATLRSRRPYRHRETIVHMQSPAEDPPMGTPPQEQKSSSNDGFPAADVQR